MVKKIEKTSFHRWLIRWLWQILSVIKLSRSDPLSGYISRYQETSIPHLSQLALLIFFNYSFKKLKDSCCFVVTNCNIQQQLYLWFPSICHSERGAWIKEVLCLTAVSHNTCIKISISSGHNLVMLSGIQSHCNLWPLAWRCPHMFLYPHITSSNSASVRELCFSKSSWYSIIRRRRRLGGHTKKSNNLFKSKIVLKVLFQRSSRNITCWDDPCLL